MSLQVLAIIIAALALVVSAITAWLTLLMRGTIKMTRPSVIYFGPDGGPKNGQEPKVYLRSLLFCTAKKGRIIESMYVSLTRNESKQNFSVWVHGEDRLSRGSGLYVGEEGVLANHHFLAPRDSNGFVFMVGIYRLEIFAKLFGDKRTLRLFEGELEVNASSAKALENKKRGLYFDWGPDANRYIPHVEEGSPTNPIKRPYTPVDWEKMITDPL